jgi:hypothetical protein
MIGKRNQVPAPSLPATIVIISTKASSLSARIAELVYPTNKSPKRLVPFRFQVHS